MDAASPELSQLVPRELLSELLAIARSGGASFADAYAEHAIVTGASLDEGRLSRPWMRPAAAAGSVPRCG